MKFYVYQLYEINYANEHGRYFKLTTGLMIEIFYEFNVIITW